MGGFIKRDVPRVETAARNKKVNKEVFDAFEDYCKEQGYPMNVILETFMQQYAKGRFYLHDIDILKWKAEDYEEERLNTTVNKEIYQNFKRTCKENGFFVKHVIMAFLEAYSSRKFVLEFALRDRN